MVKPLKASTISAKPVFYYWCLAIAMIIIGINIIMVMGAPRTDALDLWAFLLRNILTMVLLAWLVIWYASAFTYLQKEVYKR
jgi:hypothetical protein